MSEASPGCGFWFAAWVTHLAMTQPTNQKVLDSQPQLADTEIVLRRFSGGHRLVQDTVTGATRLVLKQRFPVRCRGEA